MRTSLSQVDIGPVSKQIFVQKSLSLSDTSNQDIAMPRTDSNFRVGGPLEVPGHRSSRKKVPYSFKDT